MAWSLEQTKFFTLGCDNLVIVVDHKPLLKILGDCFLDEIKSPRLFRIKTRTLMWKFDIEYQPGKSNHFSDAVSRYPNEYTEVASAGLMGEVYVIEDCFIASITEDVDRFFAVTIDHVREKSLVDPEIVCLTKTIQNGFPQSKREMPQEITGYWDVRRDLYSIDGVVLYMDRIVIPKKLRNRVIKNLHSAHQGTGSMCARAKSVIFWPGITSDIDLIRNDCRTCHRNSPSQAKTPPMEPRVPTVPFEMIFADYFKLSGHNYLVVGDRLSGWTEVFRMKPTSGSKGLCKALRRMFGTFGRPINLSSDGGPEFVAARTEDFLKKWGVSVRVMKSVHTQR